MRRRGVGSMGGRVSTNTSELDNAVHGRRAIIDHINEIIGPRLAGEQMIDD